MPSTGQLKECPCCRFSDRGSYEQSCGLEVLGLVAMVSAARWNINSGVTFEKAIRNQQESDVLSGHHWIVLKSDVVGESETVPNRYVSVRHWAVFRRVLRQTLAGVPLRGVIASCISFCLHGRRHPQIVFSKSGTLAVR